MSQYFTGSQTKDTSIAAFTCFAVMVYPGFLPQGGQGGALPEAVCPPENFCPPAEIWSENNSITKEICIAIDFAPP